MTINLQPTSIRFHHYREPRCTLCGDKGKMTREHKIKQSLLAEKFGKEHLHIGPKDPQVGEGKNIQSTKSKYLKFNSKICEQCNTVRTQPADRQFDSFVSEVNALQETGKDPTSVFNQQKYATGSLEYLNLFRYFAKILCCFLAEENLPCPKSLSAFAIGNTEQNCVGLRIEQDDLYNNVSAMLGPTAYGAHSGLSVHGNKRSLKPDYFISAVSFGPLRFLFWYQVSALDRVVLKLQFPLAYSRLKQEIYAAKEITDGKRRQVSS